MFSPTQEHSGLYLPLDEYPSTMCPNLEPVDHYELNGNSPPRTPLHGNHTFGLLLLSRPSLTTQAPGLRSLLRLYRWSASLMSQTNYHNRSITIFRLTISHAHGGIAFLVSTEIWTQHNLKSRRLTSKCDRREMPGTTEAPLVPDTRHYSKVNILLVLYTVN